MIEKCTRDNVGCKELCDQNIGIGCFWLGQGQKDKGNLKAAKALFKKGCRDGVGETCGLLKSIVETEKDKVLCGKANSGHCMNLALSKKDLSYYSKAKETLLNFCNSGDPAGCEALAQLRAHNGEIVSAMMSFEKAKSTLQKKCDDLDMKGCVALAKMITYTEDDYLEVKNLLEKACYYFENREGCENLADFEKEMGMGDPSGEKRVCKIVGVWCSRFRGKNIMKELEEQPKNQFTIGPLFYQRFKYQMTVQEWIPRGLTIIPLEMEEFGWGKGVVY